MKVISGLQRLFLATYTRFTVKVFPEMNKTNKIIIMKTTTLFTKQLIILMVMLFTCQLLIAQTIPQKISFQGRLLESDVAVTGTRDFTFSFVGTGWTEMHPAVQVTNGLYTVILGSTTPIPISVFNDFTSATLHIVVNTTPLSPDIAVGSAGYAFKAEKADEAASALIADDATKIGGTAVSIDAPLGNQYLRYNGTAWAPSTGDWQQNSPNNLVNTNEGNVFIGNAIGNGKLSVYTADQTGIASRTTGTYGLHAQMESATNGTGLGYGNSQAAVLGYAYNGRQYQFGVAGYRYSYGEGNSAGVYGAVSISNNPPAWGALGYEDTGLGWWGGYFHGNIFTDGQLQITGGSPGAGKVLTSDLNGLASWQTAAVSSQWTTSGQNIYYNPTGGSGYVGIGLDVPTAALHVKIQDVDNDFHTMEVENTSTSNGANNLIGIYGKINSTSEFGANAAVYGYAAGTTGGGIGLKGISAGDLGIGIYAASSSGSNNTKALMAVAGTDSSFCGYFLNGKSYFSGKVGIGVSAPEYQLEVKGENASYSGTMIDAENTATGMDSFSMAIQGKINTSATVEAGTAINGLSVNTAGAGIGVTGRTAGVTGKGVVGIASHASGVNYGVYARTYSASGFAGYFLGGKNYFEGKVGLGTTAPDESLVIGSPLHGAFSVPAISVGDDNGGAIDIVSTNLRFTTQVIPLLNSTIITATDADGYGLGNIVYIADQIGIGITPTQAKLHVHNGGNEHTAYFAGSGDGLNFATIKSENTAATGVAAHLKSSGSEAALVVENTSTGAILQAFGSNGADRELSISNNGTVSIFNGNENETIRLDPTEFGETEGAQISLWNSVDVATIILDADEAGVGRVTADAATLGEAIIGGLSVDTDGTMILRNGSNVATVKIDPSEAAPAEGGQISLWNASGVASILIDGDYNNSGRGRISTNELEITGGADIAEPFDVIDFDNIEPGTVLSIDSENAGQLKISTLAYDRCVAGIVSGASDVNPGIILKQTGTKADGKHLVALTGRVYCKADASKKPIKPGDLLTTSDLPGYAMAADDPGCSQGAILGKAMAGLSEGQGLILILVTLQ
jgi:hypothetical protein